MKEYNLSMDEIHLIVLASLYNGLVTNKDFVVTSLDVKNYLRDVRKVTITQATVSKALNDFFDWWTNEEFVLNIGDKNYLLLRRRTKLGIHYEYYLEETELEDEYEDEDEDDASLVYSDSILSDEDKIRNIIKTNMNLDSYEIQAIIETMMVKDRSFLSFCPSIRSIGAYKANITRGK
jgi:hypothetical protein